MLPTSPLIYLISNSRQFERHGDQTRALNIQLEVIVEAAAAGCQLVQIREKHLSPQDLFLFSRRAINAIGDTSVKVLINDRTDIAIAVGADGVHLRTDSMPVEEVRRVTSGRNMLIAVSTHNPEEAQRAELGGADLIVTGPVFPTTSKTSTSLIGLGGLQEVCSRVSIPVLALGGITGTNFRSALDSGAAGIAAIGLFAEPGQVGAIVRRITESHPSETVNHSL